MPPSIRRLLSFTVFSAGLLSAQGQLTNPSFESQVLADGATSNAVSSGAFGAVTGWTAYQANVTNYTDAQFTNATDTSATVGVLPPPAAGRNAINLHSMTSLVGTVINGYIFANAGPLQPNTTYTLTAAFGQRADSISGGPNARGAGFLELVNSPDGNYFGGKPLVVGTDFPAPTAGFADGSVTFTTPATVSGNLIVAIGFLGKDSSQFTVDNVRLTAAPGSIATLRSSAPKVSIMPMGDSITRGAGDGCGGYRDRLFARLTNAGYSFKFVGQASHNLSAFLQAAGSGLHNGYGTFRIDNLRDNLDANTPVSGADANAGGYWMSSGSAGGTVVYPDYILLMAGTNDALQNATLATMQTRMTNLLDWFLANRPLTRVIVAAAAPIKRNATQNAVMQSFNAWLAQTLPTSYPNYRLVDLYSVFTDANGAIKTSSSPDGIYLPDDVHPSHAGYSAMGDAWFTALQALVTPEGNLPVPWTQADVGTGGQSGLATHALGTFTVQGAGGGVTGTSDGFRFLHQPVAGDAILTARVATLPASGKAGIFFRADNAPGSAFVGLTIDPAGQVTLVHRAISGAAAQTAATAPAGATPRLRLTRIGGTFAAATSPDGQNWTMLGQVTTTLGSAAQVGLGVTSENPSALATATFDTVGISRAPLAPTLLAPATAYEKVTLNWNAAVGALFYTVKRATAAAGPFLKVADVPSGTTYADTGLTNGTTYHYVVTASNALGESPDSNVLAATPAPAPVSRSTGGTATASQENGTTETAAKAFDGLTTTKWYTSTSATGWLQYNFGAGVKWAVIRYDVSSANDVPDRDPRDWQFQGSNDGSTWITLDTRAGETFSGRQQTKSYLVSAPVPYQYHRLNVTAKLGANTGSSAGIQLSEFKLFSSDEPVPGSPAAPTGLTVSVGSGEVSLSWTASPGATTYTIKRSTVDGSGYQTIASNIPGTAYTDTAIADGTTYYYVVTATNAVGESVKSSQAGTTAVAPPAAVPYPAALDAAAVSQANLADISKKGLLLGNGEMNVIVYSSGNDLRLRIGKNDCWDMRLKNDNDAVNATVNPATGAVVGSGSSSSWSAASYPTSLPCVEATLTAPASQTAWSNAALDLARAKATVTSNADVVTVRALAQSNVLLIDSSRALSFSGVNQFLANTSTWISNADTGTQGGYPYLHQNIPGDADASGMDIYVVTGTSGSKRAIAVVTSRESLTPLQDAATLVTATLADAGAVAAHETAWQAFWEKSGIELGDAQLQNWWYRMLYFSRCFARSNGNAVGLAAAFDSLAGWHNSLKLNYNIQQTYLSGGPANHAEFMEPFIDVLTRNLNRGKWFATTKFLGAEGAFFHSDLWPFEPDPANCVTINKHQQAYLPYGYTWGMAGHAACVLWEYYKYNPSAASLDRIYPVLSNFGLFYCSVLEKCALVNSKRRIGPSYFPEIGSYNQYNVCYDIAFINAGLKAAHAAATLKGDTTLASRIAANLAQMPTYTTANDPAQNATVVENWLGSGLRSESDRHGSLVQAVFPANEITAFSNPAEQDLYRRTINRVETITTHANSNVTINIARARLGLGAAAIANAKLCFGNASAYSPEQPNGLFYWNAHGYYMTEQVAVARLVTELLLQSVNDIIRLFPAWPAGTDGRFSRLRAQGGFEVSAEQVSGVTRNVKITSTVGGSVRIVNPWPARALVLKQQDTGAEVTPSVSGGISTFPTTAGKTYLLTPGATITAPPAPIGLAADAGDQIVALGWTASDTAEQYLVQRSANGTAFQTIGSALGATYTDTGLANGTAYTYRVAAVNSFGESAASTPVTATPTGFAVGAKLGGTGIGTAGTYGSGNTRDKALDGDLATAFDAPTATGAWVGLDLGAPTVITQLRYAPRSGNAARMVGGVFQGSSSADFSTGVATLFTVSTTPATGTYTTQTIGNPAAYRYVRYLGPTNGWCNVAEIEFSGTRSAPAQPAGLAAAVLSSSQIQLTWADAATDETSYLVESSPAGANTWTASPALAANSTGFVVNGLEAGVSYDFRVSALNAGGKSGALVTRSTYSVYEQWKLTNNLPLNTPDTAAPDGDGISVLMKFATSMPLGQSGVSPSTLQSAGLPVKIQFQRRSPAPVTYAVEGSGNLTAWTTIATLPKGQDAWNGPATVSETGAGGLRAVTATDPLVPTTPSSRFLRLKILP